jgi:hypothetical protein
MGHKRKLRRERDRSGSGAGKEADTSAGADTGGEKGAAEETRDRSGDDASSSAGEKAGRVEPMNPVDIDAAALAREADGVALPEGSEAQPSTGEPTPGADDPTMPAELTLEQAMQSAAPLAKKIKPIVERFAARIVPAWKLTGEECSAVADDVALCMVLWAPAINDLPPKWMALAALGLNVYAITDARRDTEGNLLPRMVVSAGSSSAVPKQASDGATKPNGTNAAGSAGGFSTSA